MDAERTVSEAIAASGLARHNEPIFVTRPRMPPKEAYKAVLEELWQSRWLTNNGIFHQRLEAALKDFVGGGEVALAVNGTMSLVLALKLAGVAPGGSVVTTPFTFPATTHAIDWLACRPIFADVDPLTGNIDPRSVAERIEPDTQAVLAVHVYGTPCDHASLEAAAARRDIPIVYDAAHAFGVTVEGRSVLTWGRASSASFHATKLFTTVEGGAVFVPDPRDKARADLMKNFGIVNENEVRLSGLNMKMSELHAAFGLLNLPEIADEIALRAAVARRYRDGLAGVPGISIVTRGEGFGPNWAYFAIRIDPTETRLCRDFFHAALKALNFSCRKYFYPLTSQIATYRGTRTAAREALPEAHRLAGEVLCLPIYGDLLTGTVDQIVAAIRSLVDLGRSKRIADPYRETVSG